MTFTRWLKKQKDRKDPVGDLAIDFLEDHERPKVTDLSALHEHLATERAESNAHRALDTAWKEWSDAELERSQKASW